MVGGTSLPGKRGGSRNRPRRRATGGDAVFGKDPRPSQERPPAAARASAALLALHLHAGGLRRRRRAGGRAKDQ
eukprot:9595312-Alexandrium_andersonii.AAC.1